MKLIDKDALVAEIEKLIKKNELHLDDNVSDSVWFKMKGAYGVLRALRHFLDTLEVKEVDLDYIKDELDRVVKIYKPDGDFGWGTLYNIATHFFELGISVSNSIKVTTPDVDDVIKENGVNPDSKEAKIIKESYFMAIEKLAQKGE